MKILVDTLKNIENILCSLEKILNQEHQNLLNSNTNVDILKLIKKKKYFFEKLFLLSKERKYLEKQYNIFIPYENNNELNNYGNNILKKCFLLRKLNIHNKILMNKKFYLNQYFLELFSTYKTCLTYNIDGNLKS